MVEIVRFINMCMAFGCVGGLWVLGRRKGEIWLNGGLILGCAYIGLIYALLLILNWVGADDGFLRVWFSFGMSVLLSGLLGRIAIELRIVQNVRRRVKSV